MSVPAAPPVPGLAAAIAGLPPPWFAVVDGALDPQLEAALASRRLVALPLYLEGGAVATWSGPILVELPDVAAFTALQSLGVAARAAYWSWPGDTQALRRHLRSLNLVEVPAGTVTPGAAGIETVLLRHQDAEVLAPLLPLLDPAQRARFLADANGIAYAAVDHGGPACRLRPADLPDKPRGMLRLTAEQVAALSAARVRASRRRVAAYLRDTAPAQTAALDEETLIARVVQCEGEAQALGLAAERDIAKWSFLQVMANGTLFAMAPVREMFDPRLSNRAPAETLELVFDDLERRFRRGG